MTNRTKTVAGGDPRTDSLPVREISRTGLSVTILGFGGVQVGDYWVGMDEEEAYAAVQRAYELGIRYFDTAPQYGTGLSEHRIGHVLRKLPRDSFVLSTKVSRYLIPDSEAAGDPMRRGLPFSLVQDRSYDATMRTFEQSLHRLGLNRVDLLLIHDSPRGDNYLEEFKKGIDTCYRALDDLRSQGIIGGIGAGLNVSASAQWLIESVDLDCLMIAGRYTLLEQESAKDLLPKAARRNVSLIIGAPFNTGILATGVVGDPLYNNKAAPPEILHRVSAIERLCRAFEIPIAAAALQFPLGDPVVVSVVAGMGGVRDVERNVEMMAVPIPAAFWTAMRNEGLVAEEVRTLDEPLPVHRSISPEHSSGYRNARERQS